MKYKNLLYLFIILLISINIIIATDIPLEDGKFIFPENIDDITANSLKEIHKYVDLSRGQKVSVDLDGRITILESSGDLFAKFDKSMKIVSKDNKIEFTWRGFGEKALGPIEFDGILVAQINSIDKTKLVYSNINGIKRIEIPEGAANIKAGNAVVKYIGDTAELWKDSGYNFIGIGDAVLEIDKNNEVIFADFISEYGGNFAFQYKGQNYNFKTKDLREGGKTARILFDPDNFLISGENTEFNYQKRDESGNINHFNINGKFSFILNENGDPHELKIDGGIFKPDLLFGESDIKFIPKNKKPFTVFFDGREIKDLEGNSLSIDYKKKKILMKGQIIGDRIKHRVNYEGINNDAYTEFYYDGKENDGVAFFDVQKGEANIDSGKHLVNVKDGISKIRIKNGAESNPTSFRVSSTNQDGRTEAFVNEDSDKYFITSYDSSGKQKGKPIEISLSEVKKSFSESFSELALKKDFKVSLNLAINKLNKNINSLDLTVKEKDSLKLQKIILENQLDILNDQSFENSINKLKDFISTNPDSEIKAIAQNSLGEAILDRLVSRKASYDSPLAIRESEKALSYFDDTRDYAEEQLKLKNLDPDTRKKLLFLKETALLNMGKTELNTASTIGINNFAVLSQHGSSPEIRSEALRLLALKIISSNPTGNVQLGLQHLQNSVNENPKNELASETLKSLRKSLIRSRQSQFANENVRYLQDIESLIGDGAPTLSSKVQEIFSPVSKYYYQFSSRLDEHLNSLDFGLDRIDVINSGSRGIENLIDNDVDIAKYMNSDFPTKFQRVMESHDYDTYITADEFKGYSNGLRFSESSIENDLISLHSAISRDKGKSVADAFVVDFGKTTATMGTIDTAIQFDPMLHLIAGSGSELTDGINPHYQSYQKLDNAFSLDRSGQPLQRTWNEAIGLTTGDFALTAIASAGIGTGLSKTAQFSATALNVGTKTVTAVKVASKVFSPGQALALKLLGNAAPKTAFVTGIGLEVGIGFTAASLFPDSELVAAYELASVIIPGSPTPKKISRITNSAGDTRIHIPAANNREISDLTEGLVEKGAKIRTDLGKNIYQLGDDIYQLGSKIDDGFTVDSVVSTTAEINSKTIRDTQKRLSDSLEAVIKETPIEILTRETKIQRGRDFNADYHIEREKYKYFLGRLNRPNPEFDDGGLEKLIDDWVIADPSARARIKELKKTDLELRRLSREAGLAFGDPRDFLNKHVPPSNPNYKRYKNAIDFHDLSRNLELKETFQQLGITYSNRAVLENFLKNQIVESNLVTRQIIDGIPTESYKSVIINDGKKALIESRWSIVDGVPELGTVIFSRPDVEFRVPKNQRTNTNGEWVDRLPIFRLLISLKYIIN